MKIAYIKKRFSKTSLAIIAYANDIIEEYASQGYVLTLRQLYYQFVARDLIANRQSEYKRLGSVVADGRLAGLIDWDAIEDRGRNVHRPTTWENPDDIIKRVCINVPETPASWEQKMKAKAHDAMKKVFGFYGE